MAVAGNCLFAGMLADPESPGGGLINVYNSTSGEHLGALPLSNVYSSPDLTKYLGVRLFF